jgi:hypothetical protein
MSSYSWAVATVSAHSKRESQNVLYTVNRETVVRTLYVLRIARLCGLVVIVPGYRSRGLGSHSPHYQIFWKVVGLEGVNSPREDD